MIFPKIFIKGKCLNNQNYKCLQFKYIRKERYCVFLEEKKKQYNSRSKTGKNRTVPLGDLFGIWRIKIN